MVYHKNTQWVSKTFVIGFLFPFACTFMIFNRRWHISTTPNSTTKFCTLFKLIQPSNMVTLSCLAKKIKIREKKSSVYYWKWRFPKVCSLKTQLSLINWTFFPRVQILIFLREATFDDCNSVQKILVALGVIGAIFS